ncbi:nucleotidyltransferase domain-containing protein [Candidatus Woesearchaeota archaeon]|nr:nucleotidyltransferase domain-containing protein [Candidatus Woesearchaeota archaeon]
MLHDKYFHVLSQFSGDYAREVHGRGLKGKAPLSEKTIALVLKDLKIKGILRSTTRGKMKFYSLNTKYSEIRDIIIITELLNKILFLGKHRVMANLFSNDDRVVGIFGSYAKGIQKQGSDLDIFIIGEKKEMDYDEAAGKFDIKASIKYFSNTEWRQLLIGKNMLVSEMVSNHIMLHGVEEFVNEIWRYYYGFN